MLLCCGVTYVSCCSKWGISGSNTLGHDVCCVGLSAKICSYARGAMVWSINSRGVNKCGLTYIERTYGVGACSMAFNTEFWS